MPPCPCGLEWGTVFYLGLLALLRQVLELVFLALGFQQHGVDAAFHFFDRLRSRLALVSDLDDVIAVLHFDHVAHRPDREPHRRLFKISQHIAGGEKAQITTLRSGAGIL